MIKNLLSFTIFSIVIFSFSLAFSQTVIIDPANEGGFENGTTFAANGWSATTGTTTPYNHWVCGNNATTGFSGARCAYISQNGSNHSYAAGTARVSHLYRSITVPAGETQIDLNFDWICNGEGSIILYDYLRIWKVPNNAANVPTYGIGITANGTRILLGEGNLQTSWTNATLTLPTNLAGTTFRLVFEWINDNSTRNNPPAAIDNISLISQTQVLPCDTITSIPSCGTSINTNIPSGNGVYDNGACGYSTPGNEVIYSYTPTASGSYTITQNSSFTYIDYMYKSGTCSGTGWTCIDDMSGASTSPTFNLTAGTTYYFMLDPENNTGGNVNFSISCSLAAPTNDDCGTSTVLTPGESCSPTSGTTLAATSSGIAACSGNASDDVWYTFTATAPIQTITVTEGTLSDAVFEIFTGNCGSLTSALCVDDSYVDESAEITGFTAGSTYYIRVHSYGSSSGTFDICIVEPCSLGDGMGVTSLSCPSVLSGGLGLNGLDPNPVNCTAADSCVDLEATYLEFGDTTDYDVESIPYNPPYQYGCLANPISVGVDDIWSPVINLPFDFCFYGNTYNQCVAGSNGMISFNTAYATNSSGYEFSNNLPSSASGLFPNTIYGVYHDIDPSEGGEVGWELITLNTGCRALVVSYKDVPMFNDNSILYTGMMVLYENTNVIEVYISQKNIDSYDIWYGDAWNWGNAIVGIQNSDATQAVVAPGRNALDANWAVTNEAWRFTPSGGSLATSTVSWYENYGMPSETLIGNGDTIQVCPASTTTYTAEIEYSLCNGLSFMETDNTTVTVNGAKVWNGSASSDWYTDSNWTPNGVPNNSDCIVIPDLSTTNNSPIVVGTPPIPPPAGVGLNLTVKNNGYLEIEPYGTIKITDWVDIQGNAVFNLRNSASLIQTNNLANTGSIYVQRAPNFTYSPVGNLEYVYWSSPVSNFNVAQVSPGSSAGLIWEWDATVPGNGIGNHGDWYNAAGNMALAKGYTIRKLANTPAIITNTLSPAITIPVSANTALFSGVPNNGDITIPIYHGGYNAAGDPGYQGNSSIGTLAYNNDDNWNLLGNPYPSSISANEFVYANSNINGTVYLWQHSSTPAAITDPFYGDYVYNYDEANYIEHNYSGSVPPTNLDPDLYIASGQAFFVLMNHSATSGTSVTFNNGMRDETYSNTVFYRQNNSDQNTNFNAVERHRIWLDLITPNNKANTTLIGYVEGATNGLDRLYDGYEFESASASIYSVLGDEKLSIQGRILPFDDEDTVPLGVVIPNNDIYQIAINTLDGLFENTSQAIFLEDTYTNVIHDLRTSPYAFNSDSGTFNDRFILRYTDNSLSLEDFGNAPEITITAPDNNYIKVTSSMSQIENVMVYDLLGRVLINKTDIMAFEYLVSNMNYSNGTYIVKAILSNGQSKTQKVVLKQ